MHSLLTWLSLLSPTDMVGPVAVQAAYVIHTQQDKQSECCGSCKNGMVTHGDGHKTPCPCPPDCMCKAPPVTLHGQ